MGPPGAVARIAVMAALALPLAGCGTRHVPSAPPVRLSVQGPLDGTRQVAATATVTGIVHPKGARVWVRGRAVSADRSGHFSASVSLAPGTNLIDVIASAPHARPAMTALRVTRYLLVSVPDVTGKSPDAATAAIRARGLTPVLQRDSNPFAFLVPLPEQVCSQSPSGGAHVQPSSSVILRTGKVCV